MKTISMSYDSAEWTRYYIDVEVDETLTPEGQRAAILEAIEECDVIDRGVEGLGNVEMFDIEHNWPEDLKP